MPGGDPHLNALYNRFKSEVAFVSMCRTIGKDREMRIPVYGEGGGVNVGKSRRSSIRWRLTP
ncbi:MAG: hypothetical protein ACLUDU_00315 [Butyricimonas faecihominis]